MQKPNPRKKEEEERIPKREFLKHKNTRPKSISFFYLEGAKDARFAEASVTGQVAETPSENVQVPQNLLRERKRRGKMLKF